MKSKGIFLLALSTLILITVTIFASMNLAFSWVFYLTLIGQVVLIFAVYHVLTDNYTTEKVFSDWYEDRPDLSK
ncbi:hypothetical protein [Psychroflexus sp. ALD_RP9]|uniref:hypothetical protein n=1 Tax=Psychroflexus sp. ALD_RP9 TaxID=2777186 RepID=UPI001A900C15|nr:hypothetical protein [Psychroflexus sp. ALD_RP9]QSS98066.1 hypothetical protein IMZ30_04960 [Psychroflexus sp. ALD_RP9]